mgnify:FL=1
MIGESKSGKIIVALKAVIVFEGRILIIKRSDYDDFGAGTWEFPGGRINFGEELHECLEREVMEETGLQIKVGEVLYASTFLTSESRQVVVITYLCTSKTNKIKLSFEHSDYLWANRGLIQEKLYRTILEDMISNNVFDEIDIE